MVSRAVGQTGVGAGDLDGLATVAFSWRWEHGAKPGQQGLSAFHHAAQMLDVAEKFPPLVEHAVAHLLSLLSGRIGDAGLIDGPLESTLGGGVSVAFVPEVHPRGLERLVEGGALGAGLLESCLELGDSRSEVAHLGPLTGECLLSPSRLLLGGEALANLATYRRWIVTEAGVRRAGHSPPIGCSRQPRTTALVELTGIYDLSAALPHVLSGERLHDSRDMAEPEAVATRGIRHRVDHRVRTPVERRPITRHEQWDERLDQGTEVPGIIGGNLASRPRSSHVTIVPARPRTGWLDTNRCSCSTRSVYRQRSLDDLGLALSEVTFCVVDLETTGTRADSDAITEIGAVKVRGGEVLGTYQTLVNPGRPIPPQITLITGLTDAVVATAPRIESVLPSLESFCEGCVVVAHNARFDVGFLRAAFERAGREEFRPPVLDTLAIARRLLRDEVPNFRLGTLAERFGFANSPSHRALDDARATTDLLHLLIERASAWGVTGIDDLMQLGTIGGHPQAAKLRLTTDLPRSPGVYLFRDAMGDIIYVGKATNLRQRVRSYFGGDDRRTVGPMLRQLSTIEHLPTPDPLTAEILERRLIISSSPRFNRVGRHPRRPTWIRLDTSQEWPRLSVVRADDGRSPHLGPVGSHRRAAAVIEAIESVVPIRRCSVRLPRGHTPRPEATPCTAHQLGVAPCPCAGFADRAEYDLAVATIVGLFQGETTAVVEAATTRMRDLALGQRFEEAAACRDRLAELLGALERTALVRAVLDAGALTVRDGDLEFRMEHGVLHHPALEGHDPVDPIGEALMLGRHLERIAGRVDVVSCSGEWRFPLLFDTEVPRLALAV
jgi:DNA polymerase-3 subunit epsilon